MFKKQNTLDQIDKPSGSKFNQFDFFGVNPKLCVDNDYKFKSSLGSVLTIVLILNVMVALWVYGKDMFYKERPNITFSEEFVQHQERFDLTKKNMNIAILLGNSEWQTYADPTIFEIKLQQHVYKNIKNKDGSPGKNREVKDLKVGQCNLEDMQSDPQFWEKIHTLPHLYCLQEEAFIEGDYEADTFAFIQGSLMPCKNSTQSDIICKTPEVIQKTLQDNTWAFYTTDSVINPNNFEQPLRTMTRSLYGFSAGDMYRQQEFYYRNVYLEDNTGVIFDSRETKRGIQFSSHKEFVKNAPLQETGEFFRFSIRYEKVKQTRIFRTYLNIADVIAKVGGVLKVMMIGFMIITAFTTEELYTLNLVNSIFEFDFKGKSQQQQKPSQEEEQKKKKPKKRVSFPFLEQQLKESDKKEQKEQILQQSSRMKEIEKLLNPIEEHPENQVKFDTFHYILPFKCCQRKKVRERKQLINYAKNKLQKHLNIKTILNKLQEIDKLKMLLLNEEQLKLFEVITKPIISKEFIQEEYRHRKENSFKRNNFLFEDQRTRQQILQEANDAFHNIYKNNQKISKIDKRILDTFDIDQNDDFYKRYRYQNSFNKNLSLQIPSSDQISLFIQNYNNNTNKISAENNNNCNSNMAMNDLSLLNNNNINNTSILEKEKYNNNGALTCRNDLLVPSSFNIDQEDHGNDNIVDVSNVLKNKSSSEDNSDSKDSQRKLNQFMSTQQHYCEKDSPFTDRSNMHQFNNFDSRQIIMKDFEEEVFQKVDSIAQPNTSRRKHTLKI